MSNPGMRHERAFTVVEVVIAVLVLASVISAVALAAATGTKMRSGSKYDAALTAAGARAQDAAASDRDWMERANCKVINTPCKLAENNVGIESPSLVSRSELNDSGLQGAFVI